MARPAKKRQTCLEFTPLPSSSPAAASYNQQIRERAAAIGYKGSNSSQKPRQGPDIGDKLLNFDKDPLPTPEPSNNVTISSDDDDDSPIRSSAPRKYLQRSIHCTNSPVSSAKSNIDRHKGIFGNDSPVSSNRRSRIHVSNRGLNFDSDDHSDDESVEIISPVTTKPKRKQIPSLSMSNDEAEDEISHSSQEPWVKIIQQSSNNDNASESDIPTAKKKRRLLKRSGEQKEIEDELDDLKTSDLEIEHEGGRTRRKVVLSDRQIALERLKKRRAGIADDQHDSHGEDKAQSADNEDEEAFPLASSAKDMFRTTEADDEFLNDEDDDLIGAPDDIPLEFTRFATMKTKDLFGYAVEWMVQRKLNPGFNSSDSIYDLTFKKLDDEVKGLVGSKFVSSAWKPQFSYALRARPQMTATRFSADIASDKCEACNRSGHTATYQVQFQGKPYNVKTMEEVESDGEDDGDDDDNDEIDSSEKVERDINGLIIVSENHVFRIGKFCMANAEKAHSLTHWRFHLYEWIVEYLEYEGHAVPEMIAKMDKWSESKRRKFANKVVDEMHASGKIKDLYKDFKDEIAKAEEAKMPRYGSSP